MKKRYIFWVLFAAVIGTGLFILISDSRAEEEFRLAFLKAPRDERRVLVEKYLEALQPREILHVLEDEYPLCHDQAHDLGKVLFAKSQDFTESIEICAEGCTGGCFHGVLMEAFGHLVGRSGRYDEHLVFEDIKDKVLAVCDDPLINSIHRKGKCVHGMGHVFAYFTEYNLDEAFKYCALYENPMLEFYCAGGVFMEYATIVGDIPYGDGRSMHYPCDTYAEFPAACYPQRVLPMMKQLGGRRGLADECLKIDDAFRRTGCFRGVGITYSGEVGKNPGYIEDICMWGSLEDQKACVHGTVAKLSEIDKDEAFHVCRRVKNDEVKAFCDEIVGLGAYTLEKSYDFYIRP